MYGRIYVNSFYMQHIHAVALTMVCKLLTFHKANIDHYILTVSRSERTALQVA